MRRLTHLFALIGLSVALLRTDRLRMTLAVAGIVLAILATTLLAGAGIGVLETGEQQFDATDRDLWVTGGPVALSPVGGGGFENTIIDSHRLSAEISGHEGVRNAAPMGFQTVYVGTDPDDLTTQVATGVPGGGPAVSIDEGTGFTGTDTHYADGSYDGPMSHEVLIDDRTATAHDVGVGDTIYIGGTLSAARQNEFTVVGTTQTFTQFLGTPTVVLRLSELQQVTGTTAQDPSTFIVVTVESDASVPTVQADLERAYPEYDVRSNREQLEAVVSSQALLLAGAVTLVVLSVIAGAALTVNLLVLLVYQQRRELTALHAFGLSAWTTVGLVAGQGLLLGIIGGAIGVALTIPVARALNELAAHLVGFDGLVQTPPLVLLIGAVLAIGIGTLAATVAGWLIARMPPVHRL